MNKESFFRIYEELLSEAKKHFEGFAVGKVKEDIDEDEGVLYGCSTVINIKADKKYISLWFRNRTANNKPFSTIIAINDNASDYGFPLMDYLAMRPIEFDRSLLFSHLEKYEDALMVSKQLFKELKKLIATEEMQKLLFTDYKIDVPRDWSPYK